jgi:uncharacterized protein (DUF58 family)
MADTTVPPMNAAGLRQRLNPLGAAQARFRRWWQGRLPLSDTLRLTQRNVYIMPTVPGGMLAATLLVLLVSSINYQLNLGYLLTFLLAGCAGVGMHVAHGTLRGIDVQLSSARNNPRHGIGLALLGSGHWTWTDVPARGSATVHVAFTPSARGLHRVPPITAETRFPLGTFRVWCYWRPAAQVMVYPRPEAHPPPLPPGEPKPGGAGVSQASSAGEFDGVRGYRRGDPLKLVVWKKYAKAGELVSRDSPQTQQQALWLDHAQAGSGGMEQRLSRLCAWVLQADAISLDFGLRLPTAEVSPGSGPAHLRRCLEALALC